MRLDAGASSDDCLSFDPFSFDQNGLAAAEVDVSRRQIAVGKPVNDPSRRL
jgi:hypothetical protein